MRHCLFVLPINVPIRAVFLVLLYLLTPFYAIPARVPFPDDTYIAVSFTLNAKTGKTLPALPTVHPFTFLLVCNQKDKYHEKEIDCHRSPFGSIGSFGDGIFAYVRT